MKNTLLCTFFLLFMVAFGTAQEFTYDSHRFQIEKSATVDPKDITEDWNVNLQNLEMPKPGGESIRAMLKARKDEMQKKYPRKSMPGIAKAADTTGGLPCLYVNRQFEGNPYDNRVPNDNDLAISNSGILVSVINSTIYMYDVEADVLLFDASLGAFTLPLNIQQSKFDPKMVYDPRTDRFILVFLNGNNYQTSKVIVCFSSSGNPLDPWHMYKLTGNPLNNDSWSDYPVVGISTDDLYIGINTFYNGSQNNSGFVESCFWQIDLDGGYNGDTTLATNYYSNILGGTGLDSIFNICPIQGGSNTYGPHMYLLSNRNLAMENDTVFIMKVTNSVASGNAQLQVTIAESNSNYFLPPESQQPNGHTFDTNDSRILGGFMEDDKIQFVQSTLDTATGTAAIYHGFIDNPDNNPTITANLITDTIVDYGFPNISYSGLNPGDTESIITFNHSSPVDTSGCSAMYFDNNGVYSNRTVLKKGFNYVDAITGIYERWGDYSGTQRRYNQPGTVWCAGSFGTTAKRNGTWITELRNDSVIHVSTPEPLSVALVNNLFPNPSTHQVTMQFTLEKTERVQIQLYNLQGQLVRTLLDGWAKKGQNEISFSNTYLTPGTYLLTITNGKEILHSKQLIKQ